MWAVPNLSPGVTWRRLGPRGSRADLTVALQVFSISHNVFAIPRVHVEGTFPFGLALGVEAGRFGVYGTIGLRLTRRPRLPPATSAQ